MISVLLIATVDVACGRQ